jgi:hypothetical protein
MDFTAASEGHCSVGLQETGKFSSYQSVIVHVKTKSGQRERSWTFRIADGQPAKQMAFAASDTSLGKSILGRVPIGRASLGKTGVQRYGLTDQLTTHECQPTIRPYHFIVTRKVLSFMTFRIRDTAVKKALTL